MLIHAPCNAELWQLLLCHRFDVVAAFTFAQVSVSNIIEVFEVIAWIKTF